MEDFIDFSFAGAKLATRHNVTASLIVHGLSMGYNISQIGYYSYQVAAYQAAMSNGYMPVSVDELNRYKRELVKHSFQCFLDVAGFVLLGLAAGKRR